VPVSIHTTLGFADSHRDEIVKFLAAQLDKAEMIKNNPQQSAQLAAAAASERGSEVSSDAFLTIFQRIDFSIEFNTTVLEAINDTAQFLYDQGKIDSIPEIRWDTSFLEEAITLRENGG
jgi:ABC-type nitrate/sulfonate/bicarbonate transport system substrate-binding protein